MQDSIFSKSPSIVMAMQTKVRQGINQKTLNGLEESRKTFGTESPSFQQWAALLRTESQEGIEEAKKLFDDIDSGKVTWGPLTEREITRLWIGMKGNNQTLGASRAEMAVELASAPDGCSASDLTEALGIKGDEFSKMMGKLMGKGLIKFENGRYIAV